MRLFIFTAAAIVAASPVCIAQTMTAKGIDRASTNQRLENDFANFAISQRGRDEAQDTDRAALAGDVAALRTTVETLRAELTSLREQAASGTGAFALYEQRDVEGIDTDTIPITRMGVGSVHAACPAGYRFTGVYDAPPVSQCGASSVLPTPISATRHTCPASPVSLTIYCAR